MPGRQPLPPVPRLLARPEVVLVLITMVWGVTFVVVRHAMQQTGPMGFVGLRFGTAALMLALIAGRRMANVTRTEVAAGAAIGAAIAAGYGLQGAGMQTITASASAFITALYVPIVPLLQWLVLRRAPSPASWAGVVIASLGLGLMTAPGAGSLGLGRGEMLTVAASVAIAGELVLISRFAGRVDAVRVTALQMAFAAIFAAAAMPLTGEGLRLPPLPLIGVAAGMGVASAAIQLAMNWAQRSLSPTRATLIYAGEPVWAGVAGRLAGERLGLAAILGGALILAGALVSEAGALRRRKPAAPFAQDAR